MKKFWAAFASVIAVVILAFTLAGCSKSGAVQKAFEKEGYTVTVSAVKDNERDVKNVIGADNYEKVKDCKLLTCTKNISIALVVSFGSSSNVKGYYGSDEEYDKAVKSGYVNGDCMLISVSPVALDIFKKA